MESYRVYKSLPIDDFMDMTAFVTAKIGLSLLPLIQNTNAVIEEKKYKKKYLKERFMVEVAKEIENLKENLQRDMNIFDNGSFYLLITTEKQTPISKE